MKYIKTDIEGVWVIEPKVFNDARGYFFESFKQREFDEHIGHHVEFIQDNESKSGYEVLRGLHYQQGEFSQAKLVRVIKGKVVDVAVDIRKSSPTFGKYVMVELSEDNKRQFFIPRGFAHGFLVLSDEAIFTYKVDNAYDPQSEASIRWDDETIGINWPVDAKDVVLSDKDLNKGLALKDARLFEWDIRTLTAFVRREFSRTDDGAPSNVIHTYYEEEDNHQYMRTATAGLLPQPQHRLPAVARRQTGQRDAAGLMDQRREQRPCHAGERRQHLLSRLGQYARPFLGLPGYALSAGKEPARL